MPIPRSSAQQLVARAAKKERTTNPGSKYRTRRSEPFDRDRYARFGQRWFESACGQPLCRDRGRDRPVIARDD